MVFLRHFGFFYGRFVVFGGIWGFLMGFWVFLR